ncbi:MAG TPA: efflux RND transporter periplasmic adaptor subunit, partial [Candidatus Saccharimonadia bacterium]|nr:efflux RND transporter periplasmic adaptor subunit [Candidatus Saccharimonadia bacterium]
MRKLLIPLGLLSLACAVGVSGCSGEAKSKTVTDKPETPAAPVEVASVTTGALEPTYAATASLEAVREAVVRAEMPGEILKILVEEGDRVTAGQLLAQLDDARVRLELKQVATVADRLKHEAARSEKLLERQMISREAYDRARYERDTQNAAVAIVRHTLDQGAIRAPYAGIVTRRHVKEGQWLALQQPAFEIADFTELQARLDVPEKQAMMLESGQPVRFVADALGGREFTGRVERTSPVVDRASGTVGVTLALDNDDLALRPGMFVRVGVSFDQIAAATLVPKAAVIADAQRNRVFV